MASTPRARRVGRDGVTHWESMISLGTDGNGKRITQYVTIRGGTQGQAHKEANRREHELRAGRAPLPSKVTVNDFAARWIRRMEALVESGDRAARTVDGYREHLRARILPVFGDTPIERVSARSIRAWLDHLADVNPALRLDGRGDRLAVSTRRYYLRTLSRLLQAAVEAGLLDSNPARGVAAPRQVARETPHYTAPGLPAFLHALSAQPLVYRALTLLALTTGLRRGEICALTWDRLDLQTFTLRVDAAVDVPRGQPRAVKGTKTRRGARVLPLPAATVLLLLDWWTEQTEVANRAKRPHDTQHIATARGNWMHPDTLSHWFTDFIRDHNLPKLTLHGLRHTYATQLRDAGLPIETISSLLGHATFTITHNIYVHPTQTHTHAAAATLTTLLEEAQLLAEKLAVSQTPP